MKKVFKMLLMCMTVAIPMLCLPFISKAENKEVEIKVFALPENGTDEKHLMCGSSLIFAVDINRSEIDTKNARIDWNVTKKDGTAMQAVYDVQNNGKNLEVYAPYGYAEELEVSVCVNGDKTLTDVYTFETQEDEIMVGKTFFRFDLGSDAEHMVCSPTTEVWDASKQTYTITMPYVSHDNNCILFHGWKCYDGSSYAQGAKVTIPRKNGFMLVSAWYDVLNEPEIIATKAPLFTEEPAVTTGVAVTTAPAVEATPEIVAVATITPEITQIPAGTSEPKVTMDPIITDVPEMTKEPLVNEVPVETTEPIVTCTPEITKAPEVTKTPEMTNTPQVTREPSEPKKNKVSTVSKITVKKTGSRSVKVSWSKVSNGKGYRIAYSTNKSFKNNCTKYKTTKATKLTLTKLTRNKTYYVKVCAYKVVDGKKIYGTFSRVKKITLK